jgi:predicted RNA-binding Zn-ribbon protein involved in translation (DUF1610 family)
MPDERQVTPTCIECGVELAPIERREPFACLDCATVPCACGRRHGRGYVCPDRGGDVDAGMLAAPAERRD